jgi:hypothetical protein
VNEDLLTASVEELECTGHLTGNFQSSGRCKGVRVRKVGKKTPSWQVAVKNALPRSITAEPQDRQKMWMAESGEGLHFCQELTVPHGMLTPLEDVMLQKELHKIRMCAPLDLSAELSLQSQFSPGHQKWRESSGTPPPTLPLPVCGHLQQEGEERSQQLQREWSGKEQQPLPEIQPLL